MIKIFIKNIMNRDLPGQWISLPAETSDINQALLKIGIKSNDKREYYIYNYRTDYDIIKIKGNEDIWRLNDLAIKLKKLDKKNMDIIREIINLRQ